jgi:DNA-binding transcriptional ArsR family regulator
MVLEALGDRTRRQIVETLRHGPSSVGDLAARLPVSRPAISQHLTVLRHCHLVSYEEFGTRNVYRLDTTGLEVLRAWTDSFWQAVLDSYADRVRADHASHAGQAAAPPRREQGPPQDANEPPRQQKGLSDA